MTKQPFFPEFEKLKIRDFGGSLIKGNARESRPISTRRPMHLVMRSSLAKGRLSFLTNSRAKSIRELVYRTARVKGIKIYRYANSGNHLHFIVLPESRRAYFGFIRTISGVIARLTLGVERGRSKGLKFWDALPFTRILEWGRDYMRVCGYLKQNVLEALGFVPCQPRKGRKRARAKPPD